MNYVARTFASAVIRKLAYLAVAAGFAVFTHYSHAGETTLPYPSGVFSYSNQLWYKPPNGSNVGAFKPAIQMNPEMVLKYQGSNYAVSTSKGLIPELFDEHLPIGLTRIGGTLIKVAQRGVAAVSLVVGLDALLCAAANICIIDGLFQKTVISSGGGDSDWEGTSSCGESVEGHVLLCTWRLGDGGWGTYLNPGQLRTSGPCNGSWVWDACGSSTVSHVPYTSSDWSAAETALNDSTVQANYPPPVQELIDAHEIIPVDDPVIDVVPADKVIDSTTTITRDGSGTITGSQTVSDTLHVSPPANPSTAPRTIATTETIVTTNYNTSNVVTNTTTTAASTPDTPPVPDPPSISIDFVPNSDVAKYSIPNTMTSTSWGGGGCPGDRSIGIHGMTLIISMQPACTYATMVNPVLLVLAGLTAAMIIGGVKFD